MADNIQVAVRVRPVLFQKKDVEIHWSSSEGVVFQCEPGTPKRIGNPYLFDQVFGTETQNYQIFTKLVQPLIDSAMNGFNVTVLAYGQTASGKTYTMMGSQKELGIVQLAVNRIFNLIEQQYPERAFLLRCSYIEIYNDTISDLLSSKPQKLKVQELAEGHVVVHNLIETNVTTPDAVIKLMQQGNKQRKVGGTSMNERSSRSHAVFRIIVESLPRDEADRSVKVSHINLGMIFSNIFLHSFIFHTFSFFFP
jgi:centromeric protein E